ncbi:helix-turn-helix domain-containing protein [Henriciella sp. AS95]|uniref:helix-turn-helix domain-containing protein n=1 Tax=Henriciella sp. AS95 TaxID=3135782 RepID=UPI003173DCB8
MAQATILLTQIRPILELAETSGIDTASLINASGPPAENADSGKAPAEINIADYFRIQRDIARVSDDLTARFSSRKLTYKTGHFVVSQLQQAKSLLTAMESLVEHFNMMHGDAYNSLRFSDNRVSLVVDDSSFPYRFRGDQELTQLIGDCLLIKTHCLLDSLSNGGADEALLRVKLLRKRGPVIERQNRFWTVPVDYGAPAYELIYDFDLACQPLRIRDQVDLSTDGLFARVISYLEDRRALSDHQSVTARTLDLIDGGVTLQTEVARKLGVSVATYRRRLSEEGSHFRELLLETKLRRAEAMLKRGCSVAHTTEELSYSDIRAFNRAFKRWKGLTPAAFAQEFQS